MDMDVIARCDIGNGMANVLAILQYRFAITNIFQGEFMPKGNRMVYGDANSLINIHDPAGQILSSLNALNDNHTNGVAFVMDQKIGRCTAQLGCLSEKKSGKKNSYIRILNVL